MSSVTFETVGEREPCLLTVDDLRGNPRRLRRDRAVRTVVLCAALATILISVLIVLALVTEAWSFITQVDLASLWGDGWFPRRGQYSLKPLLAGTFIVTGIAMVVAAPIGIGAAIYLSEYAPPRVRRVLKPGVELLAAIPSVVLGFFAITVISPDLVQRLFTDASQFNLLAAGIAVGILTVPLVASVSEDAMQAVPQALREASYGLGARKATTSIRVVVPAAVSGLVAGLILATSRAVGETMVVFIAGGSGSGALVSLNPLEPGTTMTAAMASQATGTDQVRGEGLTFQSLFFVGLLLFVMTLVLNLLANRFVRRVRRTY
jgi:phosphate transport system permease protein